MFRDFFHRLGFAGERCLLNAEVDRLQQPAIRRNQVAGFHLDDIAGYQLAFAHKRISDVAEEMGLLVRPIGHLNVMSPPLTITEGQVDFIVETLEKAITRVTDDLVREGFRLG